jgi:hypothetical protein
MQRYSFLPYFCVSSLKNILSVLLSGLVCCYIFKAITFYTFKSNGMNNERTIDFWFCKLHFKFNLFGEFNSDIFVKELIKATGIPVIHKNKTWLLGGLKEEIVEERNVLFGKIGSQTTSRINTVYDYEKNDFIDHISNELNAHYCYFIVDIQSYIIAIEAQQIALNTIIERIIEFLPAEYRALIEIEQLSDKYDIYDKVRAWNKFTYANFHLIPTNPDSDPDFEELDKLIQNSKADTAKIVFQTKDNDTLSTDSESAVMKGIAMASAGYGTFSLNGIDKKGNVDKINSKSIKKLKKAFRTDGTDIEKKVTDFIVEYKKGKNEKG